MIKPVKQQSSVNGTPALFAMGFRVFFPLAGLFAVFLIGVWVLIYWGGLNVKTYYGSTAWHAHEMIFGYTMAVIAGFFLTAVRNWTGRETLKGGPLAALALLWTAARILPFVPLPPLVIALVDLAFIPLLAMSLAPPLIHARKYRNLVFLPVLFLFWAANLLVHLEILETRFGDSRLGHYLGLYLVMLLIAIIAGRIFPFFTSRVFPEARIRPAGGIDVAAVVCLTGFAVMDLFWNDSALMMPLGLVAAGLHLVRISGWFTPKVYKVPLLWVLYLGYFWIIAGIVLRALSTKGLVSPLIAFHAMTIGGIGGLTLGMMARISLGHLGLPLKPRNVVVLSFWLINLAAVLRAPCMMVFTGAYIPLMAVAGVCWMTAFLIFVWVYTPMLMKPRPDGLAG